MSTNNDGMIVKRVSVPIGMEELMEGLTKEVLLKKPKDLYIFAAEYFSQLLTLRQNGSYRVNNFRTARSGVRQIPKEKIEEFINKNEKPKTRKSTQKKKLSLRTQSEDLPKKITIVNKRSPSLDKTKQTITTQEKKTKIEKNIIETGTKICGRIMHSGNKIKDVKSSNKQFGQIKQTSSEEENNNLMSTNSEKLREEKFSISTIDAKTKSKNLQDNDNNKKVNKENKQTAVVSNNNINEHIISEDQGYDKVNKSEDTHHILNEQNNYTVENIEEIQSNKHKFSEKRVTPKEISVEESGQVKPETINDVGTKDTRVIDNQQKNNKQKNNDENMEENTNKIVSPNKELQTYNEKVIQTLNQEYSIKINETTRKQESCPKSVPHLNNTGVVTTDDFVKMQTDYEDKKEENYNKKPETENSLKIPNIELNEGHITEENIKPAHIIESFQSLKKQNEEKHQNLNHEESYQINATMEKQEEIINTQVLTTEDIKKIPIDDELYKNKEIINENSKTGEISKEEIAQGVILNEENNSKQNIISANNTEGLESLNKPNEETNNNQINNITENQNSGKKSPQEMISTKVLATEEFKKNMEKENKQDKKDNQKYETRDTTLIYGIKEEDQTSENIVLEDHHEKNKRKNSHGNIEEISYKIYEQNKQIKQTKIDHKSSEQINKITRKYDEDISNKENVESDIEENVKSVDEIEETNNNKNQEQSDKIYKLILKQENNQKDLQEINYTEVLTSDFKENLQISNDHEKDINASKKSETDKITDQEIRQKNEENKLERNIKSAHTTEMLEKNHDHNEETIKNIDQKQYDHTNNMLENEEAKQLVDEHEKTETNESENIINKEIVRNQYSGKQESNNINLENIDDLVYKKNNKSDESYSTGLKFISYNDPSKIIDKKDEDKEIHCEITKEQHNENIYKIEELTLQSNTLDKEIENKKAGIEEAHVKSNSKIKPVHHEDKIKPKTDEQITLIADENTNNIYEKGKSDQENKNNNELPSKDRKEEELGTSFQEFVNSKKQDNKDCCKMTQETILNNDTENLDRGAKTPEDLFRTYEEDLMEKRKETNNHEELQTDLKKNTITTITKDTKITTIHDNAPEDKTQEKQPKHNEPDEKSEGKPYFTWTKSKSTKQRSEDQIDDDPKKVTQSLKTVHATIDLYKDQYKKMITEHETKKIEKHISFDVNPDKIIQRTPPQNEDDNVDYSFIDILDKNIDNVEQEIELIFNTAKNNSEKKLIQPALMKNQNMAEDEENKTNEKTTTILFNPLENDGRQQMVHNMNTNSDYLTTERSNMHKETQPLLPKPVETDDKENIQTEVPVIHENQISNKESTLKKKETNEDNKAKVVPKANTNFEDNKEDPTIRKSQTSKEECTLGVDALEINVEKEEIASGDSTKEVPTNNENTIAEEISFTNDVFLATEQSNVHKNVQPILLKPLQKYDKKKMDMNTKFEDNKKELIIQNMQISKEETDLDDKNEDSTFSPTEESKTHKESELLLPKPLESGYTQKNQISKDESTRENKESPTDNKTEEAPKYGRNTIVDKWPIYKEYLLEFLATEQSNVYKDIQLGLLNPLEHEDQQNFVPKANTNIEDNKEDQILQKTQTSKDENILGDYTEIKKTSGEDIDIAKKENSLELTKNKNMKALKPNIEKEEIDSDDITNEVPMTYNKNAIAEEMSPATDGFLAIAEEAPTYEGNTIEGEISISQEDLLKFLATEQSNVHKDIQLLPKALENENQQNAANNENPIAEDISIAPDGFLATAEEAPTYKGNAIGDKIPISQEDLLEFLATEQSNVHKDVQLILLNPLEDEDQQNIVPKANTNFEHNKEALIIQKTQTLKEANSLGDDAKNKKTKRQEIDVARKENNLELTKNKNVQALETSVQKEENTPDDNTNKVSTANKENGIADDISIANNEFVVTNQLKNVQLPHPNILETVDNVNVKTEVIHENEILKDKSPLEKEKSTLYNKAADIATFEENTIEDEIPISKEDHLEFLAIEECNVHKDVELIHLKTLEDENQQNLVNKVNTNFEDNKEDPIIQKLQTSKEESNLEDKKPVPKKENHVLLATQKSNVPKEPQTILSKSLESDEEQNLINNRNIKTEKPVINEHQILKDESPLEKEKTTLDNTAEGVLTFGENTEEDETSISKKNLLEYLAIEQTNMPKNVELIRLETMEDENQQNVVFTANTNFEDNKKDSIIKKTQTSEEDSTLENEKHVRKKEDYGLLATEKSNMAKEAQTILSKSLESDEEQNLRNNRNIKTAEPLINEHQILKDESPLEIQISTPDNKAENVPTFGENTIEDEIPISKEDLLEFLAIEQSNVHKDVEQQNLVYKVNPNFEDNKEDPIIQKSQTSKEEITLEDKKPDRKKEGDGLLATEKSNVSKEAQTILSKSLESDEEQNLVNNRNIKTEEPVINEHQILKDQSPLEKEKCALDNKLEDRPIFGENTIEDKIPISKEDLEFLAIEQSNVHKDKKQQNLVYKVKTNFEDNKEDPIVQNTQTSKEESNLEDKKLVRKKEDHGLLATEKSNVPKEAQTKSLESNEEQNLVNNRNIKTEEPVINEHEILKGESPLDREKCTLDNKAEDVPTFGENTIKDEISISKEDLLEFLAIEQSNVHKNVELILHKTLEDENQQHLIYKANTNFDDYKKDPIIQQTQTAKEESTLDDEKPEVDGILATEKRNKPKQAQTIFFKSLESDEEQNLVDKRNIKTEEPVTYRSQTSKEKNTQEKEKSASHNRANGENRIAEERNVHKGDELILLKPLDNTDKQNLLHKANSKEYDNAELIIQKTQTLREESISDGKRQDVNTSSWCEIQEINDISNEEKKNKDLVVTTSLPIEGYRNKKNGNTEHTISSEEKIERKNKNSDNFFDPTNDETEEGNRSELRLEQKNHFEQMFPTNNETAAESESIQSNESEPKTQENKVEKLSNKINEEPETLWKNMDDQNFEENLKTAERDIMLREGTPQKLNMEDNKIVQETILREESRLDESRIKNKENVDGPKSFLLTEQNSIIKSISNNDDSYSLLQHPSVSNPKSEEVIKQTTFVIDKKTKLRKSRSLNNENPTKIAEVATFKRINSVGNTKKTETKSKIPMAKKRAHSKESISPRIVDLNKTVEDLGRTAKTSYNPKILSGRKHFKAAKSLDLSELIKEGEHARSFENEMTNKTTKIQITKRNEETTDSSGTEDSFRNFATNENKSENQENDFVKIHTNKNEDDTLKGNEEYKQEDVENHERNSPKKITLAIETPRSQGHEENNLEKLNTSKVDAINSKNDAKNIADGNNKVTLEKSTIKREENRDNKKTVCKQENINDTNDTKGDNKTLKELKNDKKENIAIVNKIKANNEYIDENHENNDIYLEKLDKNKVNLDNNNQEFYQNKSESKIINKEIEKSGRKNSPSHVKNNFKKVESNKSNSEENNEELIKQFEIEENNEGENKVEISDALKKTNEEKSDRKNDILWKIETSNKTQKQNKTIILDDINSIKKIVQNTEEKLYLPENSLTKLDDIKSNTEDVKMYPEKEHKAMNKIKINIEGQRDKTESNKNVEITKEKEDEEEIQTKSSNREGTKKLEENQDDNDKDECEKDHTPNEFKEQVINVKIEDSHIQETYNGDKQTSDEFQKAAVIIQKLWRGFNVRRVKQNDIFGVNVQNKESTKEILKSPYKRDFSAAKIQALWRSYKTRQDIKKMGNKLKGNTNTQMMKAATKIQANVRGYLQRKKLNLDTQKRHLKIIKEENVKLTDEEVLNALKQLDKVCVPFDTNNNLKSYEDAPTRPLTSSKSSEDKSDMDSSDSADTVVLNEDYHNESVQQYIDSLTNEVESKKNVDLFDIQQLRQELQEAGLIYDSEKTYKDDDEKRKNAATKIQSLFRGYKVRKDAEREKVDDSVDYFIKQLVDDDGFQISIPKSPSNESISLAPITEEHESSGETIKAQATHLMHTGEFHDSVVVPISLVSSEPAFKIRQEEKIDTAIQTTPPQTQGANQSIDGESASAGQVFVIIQVLRS